MANETSYRIDDEPLPGSMASWTVRPSMPLLAAMLAGAWMAWPWFIINGAAMGSPTRRKEMLIAAAAVAGTIVLALVVVELDRRGIIDGGPGAELALLGMSTWKLGMAYWLCTVQERTFALYEYYRGVVRHAWPIIGAGIMLRPLIVDLFDSLLWKLVVRGGL
jgi:hypothetical protein